MLSIILPSRGRPAKLQSIIANIKDTTDCPYELIVIIDEDDSESFPVLHNNRISTYLISAPNKLAVSKWNQGAKVANGDWLFICSDDIVLPTNWLSEAYDTLNSGFIALPDQFNPTGKSYTPFYMASRRWLKKYNGGVLAIPHYHSWGIDVEICERAMRAKQYSVANIIIQHNHVIWNLAADDETYRRSREYQLEDLELLARRRLMGYPNDFEGYL